MPAAFAAVTTPAAVDDLFTQSHTVPVVIFNHDPHCPISAAAYGQMVQVEGDVALVDVANDHETANAVAQRTGVKHESPQVIVLKDGKAVWSASHFAIKARAVTDASKQ